MCITSAVPLSLPVPRTDPSTGPNNGDQPGKAYWGKTCPLGLQLPGDIPQGPPCRSSTQVSGSLVGDRWVLVLFHAFNLYILSSWRGFVNCFYNQIFQFFAGDALRWG